MILRLLSQSFLRCFSRALTIALLATTAAAQNQLSSHDDVFLSLRDAASKNRVELVDKLAAQLPIDYPLHAFAEYWKLKVRQPDISDAQITQFIQRYEGQFVADRLRNDWLLMLGKRGDWKQFDAQLPLFVLADDAQVDCYAIASKAAQNQLVRAQARAVALRNAANLAGEGCMALMELMHKTQQLQTTDVWDAIHVLAEGKRTRAASQLADLINVNSTAVEQAINAPVKHCCSATATNTCISLHSRRKRGAVFGVTMR